VFSFSSPTQSVVIESQVSITSALVQLPAALAAAPQTLSNHPASSSGAPQALLQLLHLLPNLAMIAWHDGYAAAPWLFAVCMSCPHLAVMACEEGDGCTLAPSTTSTTNPAQHSTAQHSTQAPQVSAVTLTCWYSVHVWNQACSTS
jgi:hypothetical protein